MATNGADRKRGQAMFGGDDRGDHHGMDWGQALFAFLLWRELDSGRLTPGDLFQGLLGLLLALGAIGLCLLLLAGLIVAIG